MILNCDGGDFLDEWIVDRAVLRTARRMERHVHSTYEIYYLANGSMTYVIGDDIYNVEAGDAVLIPRNVIHNTVYNNSECERFLINFPKSAVADPALLSCFDNRIISLDRKAADVFVTLFNKMKAEHDSPDSYSTLVIHQFINEMLVAFCRIGAGKAHDSLDLYTELMRSAVKYVNANSASDISLSDVAEEVGLSRSFFSKKFKDITGFGFNEYLTLVRVMNAKRILAEGRSSVTETAYLCGFNDSSYFAAVFKKHIGITPYKYAKQKKIGH